MAGSGAVEPLSLLSLVEPARWQRLQDHFASVLGIPLRTLSPSRELLVNPSWPPGLPAEQIVSALKVGGGLGQLRPLPPADARAGRRRPGGVDDPALAQAAHLLRRPLAAQSAGGGVLLARAV